MIQSRNGGLRGCLRVLSAPLPAASPYVYGGNSAVIRLHLQNGITA